MVYNEKGFTFTVPAAIKDRLHSRTGLELLIIFDNANREIIFYFDIVLYNEHVASLWVGM